MIIDSLRLAKKRDFDLLIKHGHFVRGRFLDLKILPLQEIKKNIPVRENLDEFVSQLKLAISVGTKISKKATERNRLKRQLREAVRLLFKGSPAQPGFYILIMPRLGAKSVNFANLSADLKLLLVKGKVIKNV